MIKNKKRYVSVVLVFSILITSLMFNLQIASAKETIYVSVSSVNKTVGDEVTVNIGISCSDAIMGGELWLNFDSDILQPLDGYYYISGRSIKFTVAGETSLSVKFKAKNAGTAEISVDTDRTILAAASDAMGSEPRSTVVGSSGYVTVSAPANYSTDNTLKSLSISPGVLSPAFSPNVTEYTTSVGADCDELIVNAVANDSRAAVSVAGKRMDPGANVTTITVTAENGSKRVYTIRTTKDVQSGEEPAPEEPDEGMEHNPKVQVNGAEYTIQNDFDTYPLPAGYEVIDYDYNGTAMKAGQGVNTRLLLMYLENTDGRGVSGFYIYDSVAKTFTWFNEISQPNITYVILPITDQMEKPDGFTLTEYTINDQKVSVLMSAKGNYCLFYGISSNGVTGWFCYDLKDKTVQTYFSQYREEHSSAAGEQTAHSQNVTVEKNWLWKIITLVMALLTLIAVTTAVVFARKAAKNKRILVDALRGDMELEEANSVLEEEDDILRDDYEENTDEEIQEADSEQPDHIRMDTPETASGNINPSVEEAEEEYEFLDIYDIDEENKE